MSPLAMLTSSNHICRLTRASLLPGLLFGFLTYSHHMCCRSKSVVTLPNCAIMHWHVFDIAAMRTCHRLRCSCRPHLHEALQFEVRPSAGHSNASLHCDTKQCDIQCCHLRLFDNVHCSSACQRVSVRDALPSIPVAPVLQLISLTSTRFPAVTSSRACAGGLEHWRLWRPRALKPVRSHPSAGGTV